MSKDALKTASVLAFERKLDPSDALFYAGNWDSRDNVADWDRVTVRPKAVRGTISNRLKAKDQDPAKLDSQIENPNLQTVDVASLPAENDTLGVSFTLRVLSGAGKPSACNNSAYQTKLLECVDTYVNTNGFGELARRYATNLANGRFLWRNRLGAETIEVRVSQMEEGEASKTWKFNGFDYSMRGFDSQSTQLDELAGVVERGLVGEEHVLLKVVAFVRVGSGQEVYPSQELNLERVASGKSKTLYVVDGGAGMHSQKVGNAVRTIDTWYEADDDIGPIAVEPYGSVTTLGTAFRQPKQKLDFYNLLDGWVLKDKVPPVDQQHYVIAILIRGGVFGDAG